MSDVVLPDKCEPAEGTFKAPTLPAGPSEAPVAEANDPEGDRRAPLKMSLHAPLLEYEPPEWGCEPAEDAEYKLEVLKSGTIVETIDLRKRKHSSFVVIGRLPSCDVTLEHPSISRHHCILQYGLDPTGQGARGWHMFDLGSTHGSKANRKKMPAKQYIHMHIGWVLSFGLSTRYLTLLGPEEEREAEWDLSPTEMMEKFKRKALEKKLAAQAKAEFEEQQKRDKEGEKDEGIDWGMDYEVAESGLMQLDASDAHLMEDHEAFYREDPKKALSKFFEREGFDMEFTFTESGVNSHNHKWTCSIELPVDTGSGRAVHASATVSSSKKDAQVQCALEACRILDTHGVLRKSTARHKLKKRTLEENDFYDEDDDEYLDRTGQIEAQRQRRIERAHGHNPAETKAHTYQSILAELEDVRKEMVALEKKHDELSVHAVAKDLDGAEVEVGKAEDLQTKTEKSKIRQRLTALTHQTQRLEQMAKIAKPVALPEIKIPTSSSSSSSSATTAADKQAFLRKMMMVGRKKKPEDVSTTPQVQSFEERQKIQETFVPEEDMDEEPTDSTKGMALPPELREKPTQMNTIDDSDKGLVEKKVDAEVMEKVAAGSEKKEEEMENKRASTSSQPNSGEIALSGREGKEREGSERKRTLEDAKKEMLDAQVEAERELEASEKKRRKRVHKQRERKVESGGEYGEGIAEKEDQYATWLPPEGQSGDGTTRLNERFAGRY